MTKDLKDFYKSYKEWLDNGAKYREPYTREIGLCQCLYHFAGKNNSAERREVYLKLSREMDEQFEESGLNAVYPFDTKESYRLANMQGTQHLNKKRVEWVNKHAN